ncbi:FUSC family protein [Rahnella sp. SAP-1]|uniref:FUSC family protein n=2 Tax=Rouxiella aceris TaxID=2703884 RepID=A0A848MMQ5_9GAMM|nr:FUSC family protein [Rouxiella aceris]
MNKISSSLYRRMRVMTAISRTLRELVTKPPILNDVNALLFSLKSFIAAMLAYYIALRIGLARPSWSIVTVYIVSQTSVGASLSRGVYRLVGTIVGALATVLIVPNFVNYPLICSVVLAGWIAFCLYFSLLDRTPRAYAFVLAGYTASLIGFPAVFDPGSIFEIAIVRVQEVIIGILSATLIHRYVLPKRITGQFNSTLSAALRDARQLVEGTLRGPCEKDGMPFQLASALQFLQGLGTHLPYDFANTVSRYGSRRLIHDRLARLLPLTTELRDRLQFLNRETSPPSAAMRILLEDIQAWLACEDMSQRGVTGEALIARAAALKLHLNSHAVTCTDRHFANLCSHLLEIIKVLQECDHLYGTLNQATSLFKNGIHRELKHGKGYVFHRDYLMAARSTLGAFITIVIGCILWIYSAWPDGATAVSILGVCCTLFGSFDTPAPHIIKYIIGSVYGVLISLIYSFILLPQVTEFNVLVAVLAPAFLFAGSLQARPSTTFMAMGITLTLPILSALGAEYSGDFAASLNTSIALFVATGFSVVSMSLLQTVQAEAAIKRLLQHSRRDIRRRALGPAPNEIYWTNLMIDRTALLLPRLQGRGKSSGDRINEMLHYLSIGNVVSQLRSLRVNFPGQTEMQLNGLLSVVAQYFSDKKHNRLLMRDCLQRKIDELIAGILSDTNIRADQLIELLIDLRIVLRLRDKEHIYDY